MKRLLFIHHHLTSGHHKKMVKDIQKNRVEFIASDMHEFY